MLKRIITGLLLFAVMAAATPAFAEDVYVTKNGKKYHKELCRVIQNREVKTLDDKAAVDKGLAPCQRCFNGKTEAGSKKK